MKRIVPFPVAFLFAALNFAQADAGSVAPREGWAVHDAAQGYGELLDSLKAAIKAEGMYLVTQAGPTAAATQRGITIPGNRPELVAGEEAYVTSEFAADFRAAYSVDPAVKVFSGSPDGGSLSGGGELIELRMPITIDGLQRDSVGYPRYYTVIDEVCYDDDAPWPTGADGPGRSIVKIDETQPGYEPSNWTESEHRGGTA